MSKRYVSGTLRFTNDVSRIMGPNNESDPTRQHDQKFRSRTIRFPPVGNVSLSLVAASVVASESLSERVIRAKSSGSPYRNHAPPAGRILRRHIYGSVSHSLKSRAKRAAPERETGADREIDPPRDPSNVGMIGWRLAFRAEPEQTGARIDTRALCPTT